MLKQIRLVNFRKFENLTVSLKAGNILVGPNNAGKSAIIDAIRIIESCFRFSARRTPQIIDLGEGRIFEGHHVPETRIAANLVHSPHNYNEDDSVIELIHINGARATVLINRNEPVRFYIEGDGRRLNTVQKFGTYIRV